MGQLLVIEVLLIFFGVAGLGTWLGARSWLAQRDSLIGTRPVRALPRPFLTQCIIAMDLTPKEWSFHKHKAEEPDEIWNSSLGIRAQIVGTGFDNDTAKVRVYSPLYLVLNPVESMQFLDAFERSRAVIIQDALIDPIETASQTMQ